MFLNLCFFSKIYKKKYFFKRSFRPRAVVGIKVIRFDVFFVFFFKLNNGSTFLTNY